MLFGIASSAFAQERVLDDFESVAAWKALPSDGVTLSIRTDGGHRGRAMRLDYDFQGGGGYAIARRDLPLDLPENYELAFWIRGDSPVNTLEIKLVDTTGENVWWRNQRDFEFPREWRRHSTRKRHIEFAWGPLGGGELQRMAALEIVVTASTGGKGTVWIDELTFTPLEPVTPYDLVPSVRASSVASGAAAARALDGDTATAWRSARGGEQSLTIDFRKSRELGGLVLDWEPGRHATDYSVETSRDGTRWERAYTVTGGNGGRDYIYMPETESRHVRLRLTRGPASDYVLRELTVKPVEWSASRNSFLLAVSRDAPRGSVPKYVDSVQSYWTVIGVNGGRDEALINEEGMLEVSKAGFSVEPFLHRDSRLLTWADGRHTQSLEDGYLPIPSVDRRHGDLALTVTAFAHGAPDDPTFRARYRVTNHGTTPVRATLLLVARPYQVNPPWQFLNLPGGAGRIRSISVTRDGMRVDTLRLTTSPAASSAGVATFDAGGAMAAVRTGTVPATREVVDSLSLASGALSFPMEIAPGSQFDVWLQVSTDAPIPHSRFPLDSAAELWRGELNRVSIGLPEGAPRIANTIRSTLAYILINRDGPAIQPGSRSYERSWIRDGSLTSAALLRLGHSKEVREFIEWYAPFQYPNGKVPCCVDRRGADPVPEHDSHGQLIYLIAEYYRFTGDRALLERTWPNVVRAVAYIDSLRQSRMTDEYRTGDKRAFFGLVPESISHEGYSAKPMHSFWDDFFVLKGLKDAAFIAGELGRGDERTRFAAMATDMRSSILGSLRLTMAHHSIDYIPGSVELGDFDATSTTTAIAPGGELAHLPADAVRRTFERYWEEASQRRAGTKEWDAYTPYELRTVGTFVRLGQRERAHQLLADFFRDQRPAAWNHWAEVVWRDPAAPKFIGDMPHTWVGSDLIRSVTDMFAYEREEDGSLVLGAGVAETWVTTAPGVRIGALPTWYGPLTYTMRGTADEVRVRIEGGLRVPSGGIVIRQPFARRPSAVVVNGRATQRPTGDEIVVRQLPADIVIRYR